MDNHAVIVTDMSFGDAGKGTTVDYLVRQAASAMVVRHNGGPQAAHNVVTPDGRHHTFSQFGSGSFVPGVRTHLSRHMLINPLNMFREADHLLNLGLADIWQRTSADPDALVITPWQRSANRLRELARGTQRHGSVGEGVGETVSDSLTDANSVIRVRDLAMPGLRAKLLCLRAGKQAQLAHGGITPQSVRADEEWQKFSDPTLVDMLMEAYQDWIDLVSVRDEAAWAEQALQHELLVFEGAQGVLLDEHYGFHPYTTWSTTTHANALGILERIGFAGSVNRLGVLRGYTTRHGAGPFVTEDATLGQRIPDYHNGTNPWQQQFRIGYFDLLAHRYALDVSGGADGLVLTGLDRLAEHGKLQFCTAYQLAGQWPDAHAFFDFNADGTVSRIKPPQTSDLVRQARLTDMLLSCTPVYKEVDNLDTLMSSIATLLGYPITLTSWGPTAAHKWPFTLCPA